MNSQKQNSSSTLDPREPRNSQAGWRTTPREPGQQGGWIIPLNDYLNSVIII